MRRAAVALLALLAQAGSSAFAQDLTLSLPRPLRAGETAFIEVQVGAIGRREIDVTTAAGAPLGTISPFGVRPGQEAGTYPLPVPNDAIRNGRISIRMTISDPEGSPRVPTAEEVRGVKLVVDAARPAQ
jgi:hypothetical protein